MYSPSATKVSRETWLKWREHGPLGDIPYTLGGSDVATVLGISPWKTPLELYNEKIGIVPAVPVEYNQESKRTGQLNEEHIARLFLDDLRRMYPDKEISLVFDKHMYQCGREDKNGRLLYPWMLMNYDAFLFIDGKGYLLEIKYTSPSNVEDVEMWKKGVVPEYYDWQCRYYMAGLNVTGIFIVCAWGFEELGKGRGFAFITRDLEMEEYMLTECQSFISRLVRKEPPNPVNANANLAVNYYARLYGETAASVLPFEIPKTYLPDVRRYMGMDAKIKKLEEEISAFRDAQNEILVKLFPLFEKEQKGVLKADKDTKIYITSKQTMSRQKILDEDALKRDLPELYQECVVFSPEKLMQVNRTAYEKYRDRIPADKRRWTFKEVKK